MKFLFVHQNFPGQFLHWSALLAKSRKHTVHALGMEPNPVAKGVTLTTYQRLRQAEPETHPLLRSLESHVLRGEACASAAMRLKHEGFEPDVIIAHPGWGEALFLRDVFPRARILVYCEYYYAAEGQDVGFDPAEPAPSFLHRCELRLRNTIHLHSLDCADAAIAPTQWQKSTFPDWAQQKIHVIHDGIDYDRLTPNPKARIVLAASERHRQLSFKPGDEVLTYVTRNFEPVRGFPTFMRTLPEVLRRRPNAHVLIVGGDEISYGRPAPAGTTWRQQLLDEVGEQLDMRRVHFLGKVPYQTYIDLLHISKVHAYWTTPFVLSWSFLEAAGAGVPLVASATPPVMEFADALGVTTLPFFDTAAFADTLSEALAKKRSAHTPARLEATDLKTCNRLRQALLDTL